MGMLHHTLDRPKARGWLPGPAPRPDTGTCAVGDCDARSYLKQMFTAPGGDLVWVPVCREHYGLKDQS